MDLSLFERLAEMGFEAAPLPNIAGHLVLQRDGIAALVAVRDGVLGQPGSAGLITESGLAVLVWRGADPWFVARGFERRAEPAEVEQLRRFGNDLKIAFSR
jgi:hypothetical protein